MADTGNADGTASTAVPDPLWDDWDTPPRVPGIPELHLTGFDGPMDLLLDLAERQRIDLGRNSVLQLAEQFIAAMQRLERHVALERRADWLVIATRLLLLRSRLLFPAGPEDEVEAAQEAGRARAPLLVVARANDGSGGAGGMMPLGVILLGAGGRGLYRRQISRLSSEAWTNTLASRQRP